MFHDVPIDLNRLKRKSRHNGSLLVSSREVQVLSATNSHHLSEQPSLSKKEDKVQRATVSQHCAFINNGISRIIRLRKQLEPCISLLKPAKPKN